MTANTIKKFSIALCSIVCFAITSCSFFQHNNRVDEYETETDVGAVQRLRNWGIDLPDNTAVLSRDYYRTGVWDGGFDGIYYLFEVDDNFSIDARQFSGDQESFKTIWDNFYDENNNPDYETIRPSFENEMSSFICIRLKGFSEKNDDENVEYSHLFLDDDVTYVRRQRVDDKLYVGKGYFILQKKEANSNYLFSYLKIDSSERRSTKID